MSVSGVVFRALRRLLLAALGCGVMGGFTCCGAPMPPQHPKLQLVSASISPSHAIRCGEAVHVTARTSSPTTQAKLYLKVPLADYVHAHVVPLYDDGTHGDKTPGDGEWTADYTWACSDAAGKVKLLYVAMDFTSGYYDSQYRDLSLDVEPGPAGGERITGPGSQRH